MQALCSSAAWEAARWVGEGLGQPPAENSVFSCGTLFRSTVNDNTWSESGGSVSAAGIGKLELKEKMQVMQLALSL